MGPFPRATANWRWLLIGTDYFTKWVKAEPLANIRDQDMKRFVWRNIVTWFIVPYALISDNGSQFNSKAFRRYCNELGIRNNYSTPAYPQENGTSPRRSTRETPFSMTYGVEAIIPMEMEFLMMRTDQFEEHNNDSQLYASLD
ncbi:uncharacterized protein LOC142625255 [Castanea sativa]|uniref:uncharacterized protein LOC142625255 n=1 Tax=Castanea sativa TaxID=21020 RepID=UPI003F65175C